MMPATGTGMGRSGTGALAGISSLGLGSALNLTKVTGPKVTFLNMHGA